MALRTVGVRLTADVSQYMSNLKRAGAATKDFAGQLDKSAKAGNLDAVADRAGVAGIALGGMAAYAVKAAADFDKAMSGVRAATHASTKDIAALREAALQAGKDTSFSATEAAQGITELSKAGVSTADVLGGGLKGALDLAAAGQLSVGEAAETAASAMTQFRLSGKDVPHIADLLAAGAGKAQGSVHDMGMALSQSGLVASQFGLSVEDTTGTLAAFASAGLTGSDAGTSFKTMLLQLANPAEKTKNLMEELGINAYDAGGKFVGITNLAGQLQTKLRGLTQAQRDAALAQIFGSDAIRAANVLYQQGQQGIDGWIKKVNDQGYAAETARIQTDNLAGDLERLKGSLETLAIESGSGANGGLRVLVKSLDALVGQFSDLPPAVGSTLTVLAGVGGASALALAAFIKLRSGLATAVAELTAMGPAGEKAAAGLQRTASAAGKVAVAFVALEGATALLKAFGREAANVDKLNASLTKLADTGTASGEIAAKFGADLHGINDDAAVATSGVAKWLDKIAGGLPIIGDTARAAVALGARLAGKDDYQTAVQNFANLDAALLDYLNTTNDARKGSELWNRVLSESGLNTQQLADLMPNAYKKLSELNNAQDQAGKSGQAMADGTKSAAAGAGAVASATPGATEATKEYKSAAEAAAAAARGQRDALAQLSDFLRKETDPVFALVDAESKLKKAQDAASEAIKKHGKNSAEAKAATREFALAAIDLQGRVGALGAGFDGKLSPALLKTLRNAGLTDAEIKILTGQFKDAKKAADQYDGKYVAKASAPGAVTAKQQMADAWAQAKGFEGMYTAKLRIDDKTNVEAKLADLLIKQRQLASGLSYSAARSAVQKDLDRNRQRKATGGPVYGAGSATSDSIPALLSNGEHVWTAAEVMALGGQGAVTQLRRAVMSGKRVEVGDETPGFALGGAVTWPFPTDISKTKIPDMFLPGPSGGGMTYPWILNVVRAAFPGLHAISTYRPGAVTLTGNRSYHAVGRAVDFPPSKALAEWVNAHYFAAIRELITPWNSLNIHNGKRHTYTGAVWRQHNFQGGNAHDHWAMKNGGTITEPIFGVGASGRTYNFGENYQSERVIPNWQGAGAGGGVTNINLTVNAPVGSHPREIGNTVLQYVAAALEGGSEVRVRGQKVL